MLYGVLNWNFHLTYDDTWSNTIEVDLDEGDEFAATDRSLRYLLDLERQMLTAVSS